jgi:hypothetical protein
MNNRRLRFGIFSLTIAIVLGVTAAVSAQVQPRQLPELGQPFRPLIKLVGFVNTPPAPTSPQPVLTLALPGDEKRYLFTLTDLRIMAGPLITPGEILSEVKPYSTNFYLRAPHEVVTQISGATPGEQLSILAEYSRSDRVLLVKGVEKSEEPQRK